MTTITNSEGKPHFATLDGLRGIAAIAVIIMHWFQGLKFTVFGTSNLAVDFFFMLSGFVVAYSYEERLKQGFSFLRFMLLRIIRLHPLIVLGALLGLLRFEAKYYLDTGALSTEYLFKLFITVLMVPESILRVDNTFEFFQLNSVYWSLFCEFTAYVLFGILLFRLHKISLTIIATIAFIGVYFWFKTSFGYGDILDRIIAVDALPRVIFSFSIGVLLYRSRIAIGGMAKKIPIFFLLLLPALFVLPKNVLPWYVYPILMIIILPTSIMVGIHHKFDGVSAKIVNFLGEISYPVYAIHMPIIWVMGFGVKKVTGVTEPAQLVWFGLIILPVTIGLSYLALKLYDEPVRRFLKNKFKGYLTQK